MQKKTVDYGTEASGTPLSGTAMWNAWWGDMCEKLQACMPDDVVKLQPGHSFLDMEPEN